MSVSLLLDIIMKVVGGLGIFLLGMKYMSEGMQAVAGDKMRKLISSVTNNRFLACTVGTLVTCLVQSSSVTTVMVVGLVNSSFMTLTQAIGVIMGANIGTTITGWILVLKIGKYGLPILGIMALVYLFSRKERVRYTAMTIMGIGMVFFGLELMSGGFKPLRGMPEFVEWFSRFNAETYFGVLKCALVGCILTMIVQSSSATLGITIGLATTGLIPFHAAAALVLGENIGTTITALLASIGATTNARRAAVFHALFNVMGVLWITAIFGVYIDLIEWVTGGVPALLGDDPSSADQLAVRRGIAIVHSGFNITNTLLFLPFVGVMGKIVKKIIPDRAVKEVPHLTYLDVRILDTPALAVQQSREELEKVCGHVNKMLEKLKLVTNAAEPDDAQVKKLFHREEVMDVVQKEITEFLSKMLSGNISHAVIAEAHMQIRIVDEYESISDYIANIMKLHLKRRRAKLVFDEEDEQGLQRLHDVVADYVELINKAVLAGHAEVLSKARSRGSEVTHLVKELRADHIARAGSKGASPLASLVFTDMLNAYRRVKDHALNIAEALAGEK